MPSGKRRITRRAFCATGLLAAAGSGWMAWSDSWTAGFFRERLAEVGRKVPPAPHTPAPGDWSDNHLTVATLGHSSVLINFYGVWILTDPILFSRIGVDAGLGTIGPKRLMASALAPAHLPAIDLVLVSHAHFDHLDTASLGSVKGRPAAIMASRTGDLFPRKKFSSLQELKWDEPADVTTPHGKVSVRALEVRHWGARMRRDTYRGYNGYVIEREGRRLLFGGDTANTPLFAEHRRWGPFEAAMMPIGAYNPWIRSHCTPEEAVAMAQAARARYFIPLHHQVFRLSQEPLEEPIARTKAAFEAEPERLILSEIGQTQRIA